MFSETVFHAMNKNEIPYVHIGLKRMKGLKHPVRLFRVLTQEDTKKKRRRDTARKIRGLLIWILLLGLAAFFAYLLSTDFIPK